MASWILLVPVLLLVAWALETVRQRHVANQNVYKLGFPVVGKSSDADLSSALAEGYRRYPNSPFILPLRRPRVFLPMHLLHEVIHAPSQHISFSKEVYDLFLGRYTGLGTPREEIVRAIRSDLTKGIAGVLPLLQDEADHAFTKHVGAPADWTPIHLFGTITRMVALLSARVFVGLPLSRDEAWLDVSINFTAHAAGCSVASARWDPRLLPFVAPFLPEVRQTRADYARAKKWMEPLVAEVLANRNAAHNVDAEKGAAVKTGSPGTFISWILKYLPRSSQTASVIGEDQLLISFAAIHTTSMTGTMAMWDLVSHPECIKPLRDELEQVIKEDGEELDENGHPYISKASFHKLRKLDSFVKESQRCNPLSFATTNRRLMVDTTFSNGLTLPAGTPVSFPMWGVYNSDDTPLFSPEYNKEAGNPGPEVFDAFRFERLRSIPGRESKHQAVTTSTDSLNFGHGPHACPGRFFAVYEIKCMLIEFIRRYDFRLPGDVAGKGGNRPENSVEQMMNRPNVMGMLEVRKRADRV